MTIIDEFGSYPTFCSTGDVWVNDLRLNAIDAQGNKWLVQDIDGWWGLPNAELPEDNRPFSEDGDYYTAGRYSSRTIKITGVVVPTAYQGGMPVYLTEARDAFNRVLLPMVRSEGVLRVDEPDVSKSANVQITDRPLMKFNSLNNVLQFEVDLRAADPRKYETTPQVLFSGLPVDPPGRVYDRDFDYAYGGSTSSGTINADNTGNYPTYGVIRIVGPVLNPSIEHVESGAFISLQIALGVGDYVDIDLRDRTVILNSTVSRRSALTARSSWFVLQPGRSTLRFNGTQHIPADPPAVPEAMVYLTFQSAWIE